ncbi:hypothetical protein FISHEDRAFT_68607 [Fistulina hepatica ATCC 64428]|uniref:F-box domain-containing protein n=1 Tax=Fistulina hepatica ATCC 64428 TaxID=1128425 RepID=A0A0D7APH2_9AGAR|nr:hypothetical protein FISHEDRAFT_68607 [Fistulina hepatica ATCC 64428]
MVASILPQELLDHILSFLVRDSGTLAACCSASKLFSETSRSILYRSVHIEEHTLKRKSMFVQLHPHLAFYVREIHIFAPPGLSVPWISRFDPSILDTASRLDKLSFCGVQWSQVPGRIRDFLLRVDATIVELHDCLMHPSDVAEFLCSFPSLRKVVLVNVTWPAESSHDVDTIWRHTGAVARSPLCEVRLHELEVSAHNGNVAVRILLEDAFNLSKLHTLALRTTCRLSDPLLHELVRRAPDILNLSLNVPFEAADAHLFTGLFPRLESLCLYDVRIGFDDEMSGPNSILRLISDSLSLPHSLSRVMMGVSVCLKSNASDSFPDSTTDVEWTALDRSLDFVPHVIVRVLCGTRVSGVVTFRHPPKPSVGPEFVAYTVSWLRSTGMPLAHARGALEVDISTW